DDDQHTHDHERQRGHDVPGVLEEPIIIGFWILGRWIERWNGLFDKLTDKRLISGVLKQTMRMVLLLLGIFLALEVMNATALVGAVLGTAGVVGLAVGFAFRDIVENYLASIILSIRQPFRSKDYVEIGDYAGTVIRMNLRETVLMSVDGNHLTFPNAHVFKSTVINYTRNPLRRFEVVVGVGTDVDLKKASDLGLDVLRAMAGVVDDPAPSSRFQTLGDSNVLLSFYGWVDQELADFIKVNSEAIRLLKAVFDQNDIDMPVPTYRVELLRSAGSDAFESLKRPRQSAQDEAKSVDVVVENHIEEQVEQEIRKSSETNLLEDEKGPKAGKEAPPEDRRSFE
ncbi:MAG: mechanosensitive ion channel family protein, partial [Planctomycetota bacterium]